MDVVGSASTGRIEKGFRVVKEGGLVGLIGLVEGAGILVGRGGESPSGFALFFVLLLVLCPIKEPSSSSTADVPDATVLLSLIVTTTTTTRAGHRQWWGYLLEGLRVRYCL